MFGEGTWRSRVRPSQGQAGPCRWASQGLPHPTEGSGQGWGPPPPSRPRCSLRHPALTPFPHHRHTGKALLPISSSGASFPRGHPFSARMKLLLWGGEQHPENPCIPTACGLGRKARTACGACILNPSSLQNRRFWALGCSRLPPKVPLWSQTRLTPKGAPGESRPW